MEEAKPADLQEDSVTTTTTNGTANNNSTKPREMGVVADETSIRESQAESFAMEASTSVDNSIKNEVFVENVAAARAGTAATTSATPDKNQARLKNVVPVKPNHDSCNNSNCEAKMHAGLLSPNSAPTSAPKDRDIIFGEGAKGHKANLLLQDLISLHKLVWNSTHDSPPKEEEEIEVLTERLFRLFLKGKVRGLAGMKDVPRPFLVGDGRFMVKDGGRWKELGGDEAKKAMRTAVFAGLQAKEQPVEEGGEEPATPSLKELENEFIALISSQEDKEEKAETTPTDVILLRLTDTVSGKNLNNLSGNKALFTLASHHVNSEVSNPSKRLEASLSVFLSKGATFSTSEPNGSAKAEQKVDNIEKPRFVVCTAKEEQRDFSLAKPVDAAEVALLFVFEVWLEKEHASKRDLVSGDPSGAVSQEISNESIDTPTAHDVLFGRGGMTNSHPGNKRFRDVIALHRPDYIKAIKNDKPNVARRIVRAIRSASPPGRFLKKCDDGKWRDVGDKVAAEKASQALREKSNAEKRKRSAQRDAARNKREGDQDAVSALKKSKAGDAASAISITSPLVAPHQLNYVGVPLATGTQSLVADDSKTKVIKTEGSGNEELNTDGLPPNAVDEDGNILVTDWDILAGRGGLTNHHRGNKRFRDIVALHRPDYIRAPKVQKPSVARVIVRAIRNGDPPGRFLKKDEKTGRWYDIGDKKAAEKTSQALREKGHDKESGAPGGATQAVTAMASKQAFLLPSPAAGTAAPCSDAKSETANPTNYVANSATGKRAQATTDPAIGGTSEGQDTDVSVLARAPAGNSAEVSIPASEPAKNAEVSNPAPEPGKDAEVPIPASESGKNANCSIPALEFAANTDSIESVAKEEDKQKSDEPKVVTI